MKKILLANLLIVLIIPYFSTAQVKFPATAPTQTIRQEFGLGSIELTYSRPSAKGRRVFGDLVPYGKLWGTGASAATKLVFSDHVELGGKKLDSGAYLLYTIPGEESWEVIINKGIKNVGTEGYKESEDVVRFKVEPIKTKTRTESLTIQFAEIKPESCAIQLMWEKKMIVIPVTINIKEKIRAQIEAAMLTNKKPYWQAAQFYNEYDMNFNKALEYVNKAIEGNQKAYWMYLYKAKIQEEIGNYAGAIESSEISLALSKEAKNDDYMIMNQQLQKKLKKKK